MTDMVDKEMHVRAALTDLVRHRRGELGMSLRALEEACVDPDTGERGLLKSSWLNRLETGKPVIPPQLPQLRALATGLRLPLRRLQDAAGQQFFGISPVDLGPVEDVQALVIDAEQLSPDDLQRLRAMARALRDVSQGRGAG